jgi:hypothetical protein
LKIRESERVWKTSDWIIQEIGLAIGKGVKLILLIEEVEIRADFRET